MRILVTGSEGFIGKRLVAELRHVGHLVEEMDILLGANNNASSARELRAKIQSAKSETLVHLAGKAASSFMPEDDAMQTVRENTGMTSVVAQVCGELGVRLVLGSSDQVYGRTDQTRDEVNGPWAAPQSLFALSKLWNEQVSALYAPKGFTSLRFSMIYGPGMPAGPRRPALINMLWRASRGIPMPVHRGAERSWCWADDAIRACRLVIEQGEGPYNIGREDEVVTMERVARIAAGLADAPSELIEVVSGDTIAKRITTKRLRRLGWNPEVDLLEGMTQTYEDWIVFLDESGRGPKEEVETETEPEVEETPEEVATAS